MSSMSMCTCTSPSAALPQKRSVCLHAAAVRLVQLHRRRQTDSTCCLEVEIGETPSVISCSLARKSLRKCASERALPLTNPYFIELVEIRGGSPQGRIDRMVSLVQVSDSRARCRFCNYLSFIALCRPWKVCHFLLTTDLLVFSCW